MCYLSGVFACRAVNHDADVVFVDDPHFDFRHFVGGFGAAVVSAASPNPQSSDFGDIGDFKEIKYLRAMRAFCGVDAGNAGLWKLIISSDACS